MSLGATSLTLKDTALLAGGLNPTGTITFTLYQGNTLLDTETATVSGNGSYATPTGYTLPTAGAVTGTYQWDAIYSGDTHNSAVSDGDPSNEQVKVSPAGPTIPTTIGPAETVVLGDGKKLTDEATLKSGYNPTGTITFMLYDGNNNLVDTETAAVNGNGPYYTPKGYLPTTPGTYQWVASYGGDSNNNPIASTLGSEPKDVSPATPAISTTVSTGSVVVGGAISDSATVSGGYNPTGTVTFNLYDNPNGTGTPLFTDAGEPLSGGVANSTSYTATAHGHGLLGGDLQRGRQQQQRSAAAPPPSR